MAGDAWGGSWGASWGDSWGFEGFVEPPTPPPVVEAVIDGGGYVPTHRGSYYWKRYHEGLNRKKKKKVDELEVLLDAVQAQIVKVETGKPVKLPAPLVKINMAPTLGALVQFERDLSAHIAALQAEIDDEEVLLLSVH